MLSRTIGILIAPALVVSPWILPLGHVHATNAFIFGTLVLAPAALSLCSRRGALIAALIGAWVALSGFVLASTFLELILTEAWGVTMFVSMIGPFSEAPRVETVVPVRAPARASGHEGIAARAPALAA